MPTVGKGASSSEVSDDGRWYYLIAYCPTEPTYPLTRVLGSRSSRCQESIHPWATSRPVAAVDRRSLSSRAGSFDPCAPGRPILLARYPTVGSSLTLPIVSPQGTTSSRAGRLLGGSRGRRCGAPARVPHCVSIQGRRQGDDGSQVDI